jgi:hypothetical protein
VFAVCCSQVEGNAQNLNGSKKDGVWYSESEVVTLTVHTLSMQTGLYGNLFMDRRAPKEGDVNLLQFADSRLFSRERQFADLREYRLFVDLAYYPRESSNLELVEWFRQFNNLVNVLMDSAELEAVFALPRPQHGKDTEPVLLPIE